MYEVLFKRNVSVKGKIEPTVVAFICLINKVNIDGFLHTMAHMKHN